MRRDTECDHRFTKTSTKTTVQVSCKVPPGFRDANVLKVTGRCRLCGVIQFFGFERLK